MQVRNGIKTRAPENDEWLFTVSGPNASSFFPDEKKAFSKSPTHKRRKGGGKGGGGE